MFSHASRTIRSVAPKAKSLSTAFEGSGQRRHLRSATPDSQNATAAEIAAPNASSVSTAAGPERHAIQSAERFNYFDAVLPRSHTDEQLSQKAPLARKVSDLPLVQELAQSTFVIREEFYWPLGKGRLVQAPETFVYGGLSGDNDLPLPPLVYRWKSGHTPNHLDVRTYSDSFRDASEHCRWASVRVPGVTSIHYVGPNLGFSSTGSSANEVHPGVSSALLDEITARVSFANTPDKPTFTANFNLDYVKPIPVDCVIVLDAWITRMEGRKTFIASYVADALSGQVLVKAKSLFVSTP
ncbi:hypothetical protein IWW48_001359 [Coemansia sp. RSA 1200]|nr:hypothetical protein IWW48_001359 [Coemansia sp. RSA 1200]